MLGLLLTLEGPPTRDEVKDLVLRHLVLRHDNPTDYDDVQPDHPDCQKAGDFLAEAYVAAYWNEEHDGLLLTGDALYEVVNANACRKYIVKVRTWLKGRGQAFDHVDNEWARERVSVDESEACSMREIRLPRKMAVRLGQALGELAAVRAQQLTEYAELRRK